MSQTPEKNTSPETQEFEQTPKELLKLEIGTGGICAGYDPREFRDGTMVVTVDMPYAMGAARLHVPENMSNTYEQLNTVLKKNGDAIPNYSHKAIFADARKLPFADNTFSQTLMCNVMGDPGIEHADAAALLSEVLRVSDSVVVSEELTAFVAVERLEDLMNLREAGIVLRIASPEERQLVMANPLFKQEIVILTKSEGWGEVPLECPTYAELKHREYLLAEKVRRQARKDKFARSLLGRAVKHVKKS